MMMMMQRRVCAPVFWRWRKGGGGRVSGKALFTRGLLLGEGCSTTGGAGGGQTRWRRWMMAGQEDDK